MTTHQPLKPLDEVRFGRLQKRLERYKPEEIKPTLEQRMGEGCLRLRAEIDAQSGHDRLTFRSRGMLELAISASALGEIVEMPWTYLKPKWLTVAKEFIRLQVEERPEELSPLLKSDMFSENFLVVHHIQRLSHAAVTPGGLRGIAFPAGVATGDVTIAPSAVYYPRELLVGGIGLGRE